MINMQHLLNSYLQLRRLFEQAELDNDMLAAMGYQQELRDVVSAIKRAADIKVMKLHYGAGFDHYSVFKFKGKHYTFITPICMAEVNIRTMRIEKIL